MPAGGLLLGVDGGGTHTRALVADAAGRVLGRGMSGSTNQATVGSEAASGGLALAVGAALAEARAAPADVAGACFGMAGFDRPQDAAAFWPAITALRLGCQAELVNDAVIAWAGAGGGQPGIAVCAGTGSVGYAQAASGRSARAGGWGAPFGDEGSAYFIACEALRRVLRGVDGRDPPAPLGDRLAAASGFAEAADLCLLARADRLAPGEPVEAAIAALAPAVVAAADAGDADAAAILDRAADELFQLAMSMAAGIGAADSPPPVYGLGSVLFDPTVRGPTAVARRLDARLRARTGAGLRPPAHVALVGALVLAWRSLWPGVPVPGPVFHGWGSAA